MRENKNKTTWVFIQGRTQYRTWYDITHKVTPALGLASKPIYSRRGGNTKGGGGHKTKRVASERPRREFSIDASLGGYTHPAVEKIITLETPSRRCGRYLAWYTVNSYIPYTCMASNLNPDERHGKLRNAHNTMYILHTQEYTKKKRSDLHSSPRAEGETNQNGHISGRT